LPRRRGFIAALVALSVAPLVRVPRRVGLLEHIQSQLDSGWTANYDESNHKFVIIQPHWRTKSGWTILPRDNRGISLAART
jgi:hypothetical protein